MTRSNGAQVVDRTNHHLFQTLLYQVATEVLPAVRVAGEAWR